jgi:hypothetical protein
MWWKKLRVENLWKWPNNEITGMPSISPKFSQYPLIGTTFAASINLRTLYPYCHWYRWRCVRRFLYTMFQVSLLLRYSVPVSMVSMNKRTQFCFCPRGRMEFVMSIKSGSSCPWYRGVIDTMYTVSVSMTPRTFSWNTVIFAL